MDLDTRSWLISFVEEDIPFMSAMEMLHRIAALREMEYAARSVLMLSTGQGTRASAIELSPATHNGYANLRLTWLMDELRERGEVDREGT